MEKKQKYIFKPQNVCPAEIHFQVNGAVLEWIRFVGGGCPGNAQLVARLLEGQPVREVLPMLEGIECREGTSCPDQLAEAIRAQQNGTLKRSTSFRVSHDPVPKKTVGLFGELNGDHAQLQQLSGLIEKQGVEAVYCTGNLIGQGIADPKLAKTVRDCGLRPVAGDRDWACAQDGNHSKTSLPSRKTSDFLLGLPHVISFRMGDKTGVLFFGDYLQRMPGYSDFEPYALEINMVCGLADFMRDETVFPALETMASQFQADIIIFGQSGQWGHWQLGGKDFISLGPAAQGENLAFAVLELNNGRVEFLKMATTDQAGR